MTTKQYHEWRRNPSADVKTYVNEDAPWEVYLGFANFWYGRCTTPDSTLQVGPYETKEDAMNWSTHVQAAKDFLIGIASSERR